MSSQKKNHYDLIVIGAGATGSTCAEAVNKADKLVALIEKDALGGTCLNYGCDPTKALLDSVHLLHEARSSSERGLNIPEANVDWQRLQQYVANLVETMRGGTPEEARAAMRQRGLDLFIGEASFVDAHTVAVNDQQLTADQILIATGAAPLVPPIPHLELAGYSTNREIIYRPQLMHSLAIVGGGPIGTEFAQLFARLGVQVTLIEMNDQILPLDEPQLAAELADILARENVQVELQTKLVRAEPTANGDKRLTLRHENGYEKEIVVEELLLATGRKQVVNNLNLAAADVAVEDGTIVVDEALCTSAKHIWSAGDVVADYQFTHVAWRQGQHVANNILNGTHEPFVANPIPWVTYTRPALAHVGQTEAQLKEAGVVYKTACQPFTEVARAMVSDQTEGQVKLLVGENGRLLGGHILADHAGDLLAPLVLAMQADLPIGELQKLVPPYPTMSEAIGHAARQLG